MLTEQFLLDYGFRRGQDAREWLPILHERAGARRVAKMVGQKFYVTREELNEPLEQLASDISAPLIWLKSSSGQRSATRYPGIDADMVAPARLHQFFDGLAKAIAIRCGRGQHRADTYFINSDARANGGVSYHDAWIERGIAVASGADTFLDQIRRLQRGDTLLLWANGRGVVAAGTVVDDAPLTVARSAGTVSPGEAHEYHRRVAWYADLRGEPLSAALIRASYGSNPSRFLAPLRTGKADILALIDERAETIDIREMARKGTEYEVLRRARRGQGRYRDDLLTLWDRKCAVTGCDLETVLRASHALAWRLSTDPERLDANNGLPLVATLDAMFDRGLIGFADDGAMLLSPLVLAGQRALLGLPLSLRKPLNAHQQRYLKQHSERFALAPASAASGHKL